tara:strand:- start:25 stop:624 length:600 start_codon:yes stop_codon:yes gene_type:complete
MSLKTQKLFFKNEDTITGPLLITPNVFKDERGFFMESWNIKDWEKILNKDNQSINNFVQDNHSKSTRGVLRGLHYQKNPYAQGKLVRCISGEIFDIAVDIRNNSPTFGKWVGDILSCENKNQLWIPEGFAHGFLTLSSTADVAYKATNFYNKESEGSIIWNDDFININWEDYIKKELILVSEKDNLAPKLCDIDLFNLF